MGSVNNMALYIGVFYTLINAKNEKDRDRKIEQTAEKFSKSIRKKVEVHGWAEVEKANKVKVDNNARLD